MSKLNRLGSVILSILEKNEKVDAFHSMTVSEIFEEADGYGYKENTFYRKLKEFEKDGFVKTGLKEGKAFTFFITEAGIEFLEREKKGEN